MHSISVKYHPFQSNILNFSEISSIINFSQISEPKIMSSGQPGASSSGGAGSGGDRSGTGNAARMSKYKNAGLDTQELRRRRTCSSHVFTNPEFSIYDVFF